MPCSYCYVPIVQGGLHTRGHRSSNVGEDGTSGNFPLRKSTEEGLQIESSRFTMKRWQKNYYIFTTGYWGIYKCVGTKKCRGSPVGPTRPADTAHA